MPTASLVFFYFGESSYVNRLAQETVPLHKALTGYDRTVLLRHETDIGSGNLKIELSEKAEQAADVVDLPTRENLAKYLNELGAEGYVVDLYIFSHGSKDCFRVSNGTYGDNSIVTQGWLEARVKPLKLRVVYQVNCYGSTMNDLWRKLGAKVTAGSQYVNFYPTRFRGFINEWLAGSRFGAAVYRSDTALVHTPVQAYMLADAAGRLKEWDGNAWQATRVLGDNEHAKRYFTECWLNEGEWVDGQSGKQNMNNSSKMILEGQRKLTKADTDLGW